MVAASDGLSGEDVNISNSLNASAPVDTVAPNVTVFSMPATYNNLRVPIITLTGTDTFGVTG